MRIGLISNTLSERNKRGIPRDARDVVKRGGIIHETLDGVSDLASVLRGFAEAEIDLIAINGGDGTVSAILTEIFETKPFASPPTLALIARGMTNMTAGDVGLRGAIGKALTRLITRADDNGVRVAERNVIRVATAPGERPHYGMFFGTAAICRAIRLCRQRVHSMGLSASPAVTITLAYLIVRGLFGSDDDVFRGDSINMRFDDGHIENSVQLLALVTTLDRLVLGSRPFWGQGTGALRFTRIAYPAPNLASSARRILFGGAERDLPPERYMSRNVDGVSFEMSCPFTIDGEFFEPQPGTPVILSTGGRVRFLQC